MPYKKKIGKMPSEFDESTVSTVARVEANANVLGIMFFRQNLVQLSTVPVNMCQPLSSRLPALTSAFQHAIGEIDVLDELVAYRIETTKNEIIVVVDRQFAACVVQKLPKLKQINTSVTPFVPILRSMKIITNLLKDSHDEWLVKTTASLNKINPVVDRIMEDDSVEGVIMTNKQGVPVLTNMNVIGATNYGVAMRRLGYMTHLSVTEIDPFDEVLVFRIKTRKLELMVAPYREFNVVVIQHARATNRKMENDTKQMNAKTH